MFFALSKLVGFFVQPSNMLIAVGLLGVIVTQTRFSRGGQRMLVGSILTLAACGFSPIGNWTLQPLEQRFPPWDEGHGAPDGIIVLGGVISHGTSLTRPYPGINDAAERITVVSKLAQQFPNARLIYSGGSEANTAADLFETFGISRSRIELELRSRNTIENAIFTKEIAKPKLGERWLLITSAFHMPRAIGVFRQLGFPVEAYPVDWRTPAPEDDLIPFVSLADGPGQIDLAFHEWAGLIAYRVTGKTSALFPAPVELR
jgi:uncharacterized SAM-binding protein YcdF (DUF218 family)